jgi:transposase|nr:MAG TPA: hypothetical protein [Caudoviricetes sp.]
MNKEKIMSYILQGKPNKEIAELCNVSVRTVERHRKKVKEATSDNDKKSDKKTTTTTNKRSKIDWLKLETEYVTDISEKPVTLKDLSKKYNANFNVVQNYSADNNWTEKRKNYIRDTLEKTKEKLSDETSDVMADILNNINTALLQATEELHIHEEVTMMGKLIKHETETVRANKLGTIVKALTSMQKIEIEKQRLEIEKSKIDKEAGPEEKAKSQLDKLEELLNGVGLDD